VLIAHRVPKDTRFRVPMIAELLSMGGGAECCNSNRVNPLGYMGVKSCAQNPSGNPPIRIPAEQPHSEIDVLNLGSSDDLMVFPTLAFIEVSPILAFRTEIF
jgi:hypothetical protein